MKLNYEMMKQAYIVSYCFFYCYKQKYKVSQVQYNRTLHLKCIK